MRITIKLWGYFTKLLPSNSQGYQMEIECADGLTAREVIEEIKVPFKECRMMLLNGTSYTEPELWSQIEIRDGDTMAVLPNIH